MRDESLNLEVRDFGPIGRARVELRPLTVFVGPSNTGKSYLAMLIYALHKHFSRFDSNNWWHAEDMVRQVLLESGEQLAPDVRKVREAWNKGVKKRQTQDHVDNNVLQTNTWELSGAFKELVKAVVGSQGNVLRREIEHCFGASLKQLTRKARRSKFNVLINRQPKTTADQNRDRIGIGYTGVSLDISIPDRFNIEVSGGRRRFADLEMEFERFNAQVKNEPELAEMIEFSVLFRVLREIVSPALFGTFGWPAHYLPTSRAELIDSFDLLVGSIVRKSSSDTNSEHRVPGIKSDFLEQLRSLGRLKPKEHDSVLTAIEQNILKGSISIHSDDKLKFPQFRFKPANWGGQELPLKNASSMVSEVGPISLYEKHIVKQGELLIVDEPESHLHPGLQVELTNYLARMVQAGKRVLITTHSEWITEALANVVNRSAAEKLDAVAEPKPGLDFASLREDEVGVWLFEQENDGTGGSTVKQVKPDEDSRLYDTEFDNVANSLHNEWCEITDKLRNK